MKTLYFFLIIFFISCNKKLLITERNKDVEIEIDFVILNKKIKFGDSIIIKVYNNSNNNYYLPIDFLNKGFNPYIDKNIEKSFYPEFISNNIIGFRKKMQSANNFHENKTLKDFYYFNELNNFFLIKQKGTKNFKNSI